MDGPNPHAPSSCNAALQISTAACDRHVREAQRLFHRTLSGWASDLLLLRQRRLRYPSWADAQATANWSKAA